VGEAAELIIQGSALEILVLSLATKLNRSLPGRLWPRVYVPYGLGQDLRKIGSSDLLSIAFAGATNGFLISPVPVAYSSLSTR
jgi:hypothetical protein